MQRNNIEEQTYEEVKIENDPVSRLYVEIYDDISAIPFTDSNSEKKNEKQLWLTAIQKILNNNSQYDDVVKEKARKLRRKLIDFYPPARSSRSRRRTRSRSRSRSRSPVRNNNNAGGNGRKTRRHKRSKHKRSKHKRSI